MSTLRRRVVDAHHHFWELGRFPYAWLRPEAPPRPFGDHTAIKRDFLPADYRAAMAGLEIVASVHVEANAGAPDPTDECRWLDRLSDEEGGAPDALVAQADLLRPDIAALLSQLGAIPRVRGVRAALGWGDDPRWRFAPRPGLAREPAFMAGAAAVASSGFVLDVIALPAQLADVAELARREPRLVIVINHLAMPLLSDALQSGPWRAGMRLAAAQPNIAVKLSGLWPLDRRWDGRALRDPVRLTVELFGPARCMWGSNLPIESLMCAPRHQVAVLEEILHDLPDAERDAIFIHTALRTYRIGAPA